MKKQLDEAEQVTQHRHVWQEKYGEVLRLRSYAVVALGFERLVWEDV